MFQMLPIPVVKIATGILKLRVEMIERFPQEIGSIRTLGIWDPIARAIFINQSSSPQVRLFTIAHEIGHCVEHPTMTELHRDLALDRGEPEEGTQRDPRERRANQFASSLLMPAELVQEIVQSLYGDWLSGARSIEDLLFWLRPAGGGRVDARTFFAADCIARARWICQNTSFEGRPIPSLTSGARSPIRAPGASRPRPRGCSNTGGITSSPASAPSSARSKPWRR